MADQVEPAQSLDKAESDSSVRLRKGIPRDISLHFKPTGWLACRNDRYHYVLDLFLCCMSVKDSFGLTNVVGDPHIPQIL